MTLVFINIPNAYINVVNICYKTISVIKYSIKSSLSNDCGKIGPDMEQGKNWEVSGPIDDKYWVTTGEGPISELTVIIYRARK